MEKLLTAVNDYLENKEMALSRDQLDAIAVFLTRLEMQANPRVRRVINKFKSALRKEAIVKQLGIVIN